MTGSTPETLHRLRQLPRLAAAPTLASEGFVAGADVGGTHQTVALARLDGEVVAAQRRRLRAESTAREVLANVFDMIDATLSTARLGEGSGGGERLVRVGLGFGGPIDQKRGTVLTSHHVPGWNDFPLRDEVETRLNVSAVVDNDANAAALGEALFGAGRGHSNLLYVNVGTGIGAGLILHGRLYHGEHGMAGEIGHVTVLPGGPECPCGKRGCLEAVASGRSLARRAAAAAVQDPQAGRTLLDLAGGPDDVESPHVFAAARQGDALARRLVDETAGYLAQALGNATNMLDPSIVVVGGGLAEAGDLLFLPLRAALWQHVFPSLAVPPVVPAALGYDAGIVGALALALNDL